MTAMRRAACPFCSSAAGANRSTPAMTIAINVSDGIDTRIMKSAPSPVRPKGSTSSMTTASSAVARSSDQDLRVRHNPLRNGMISGL